MSRHISSDAPFLSDFAHMHLQFTHRHDGAVKEVWSLRCDFSHHRCGSTLLHLQGQPQSLLGSSRRNLQDPCPLCMTCQGQIQKETDSFALVRLWKNCLLEQLQCLAWAVSSSSTHSRLEWLPTFHSGRDDLQCCSALPRSCHHPHIHTKCCQTRMQHRHGPTTPFLSKIIFSVSNTFPVVHSRYEDKTYKRNHLRCHFVV